MQDIRTAIDSLKNVHSLGFDRELSDKVKEYVTTLDYQGNIKHITEEELAARVQAVVDFCTVYRLEYGILSTQHDEGGSSSLSQASPNKWLAYGLHLLLPKDQRESVIGDLEEEYSTIIFPRFGKRTADFWYAKQVMSSILPIVQARLLKLIGWATGGLGLGSAVEWFRKWSGGD